MTLNCLRKEYQNTLVNIYEKRELENIFRLILSELTGFRLMDFLVNKDEELQPKIVEKSLHILKELETGKPPQYVLGHTEFFGLKIRVNENVLIPRPETEELIYWIRSTIPFINLSEDSSNILDIGTGSGCIALALKSIFPNAKVNGLDVSGEAIEVAKSNADQNNLQAYFFLCDINDETGYHKLPPYNLIVSNPPYVTSNDKNQMKPNVLDFEPHLALFAPENDPLKFYKSIASFAQGHLLSNDYLFLECNMNFAHEVSKLLHEKGFREIEIRKDLSERDRMIRCKK